VSKLINLIILTYCPIANGFLCRLSFDFCVCDASGAFLTYWGFISLDLELFACTARDMNVLMPVCCFFAFLPRSVSGCVEAGLILILS
jgi:hypothetical protein